MRDLLAFQVMLRTGLFLLLLVAGAPASATTSPEGAAVLVQVRAADSDRPLAGASVERVPLAHVRRVAAALVAGDEVDCSQGVKTDQRGWARLSGLSPPAAYLLVTASGRAPALRPVPELEAGSERVVEPISLKFPASLQVNLDGVPESVGDNLSLHVELTPERLFGVTRPSRISKTVEAGAAANFSRLIPGSWWVEIELTTATGLAYATAPRRMKLAAGDTRCQTIELENRLFSGEVRYQGKPIRARLTFDPEHEIGSSGSVRAEADAEGAFQVLLPGPGDYTVQVGDLDGIIPSPVYVPDIRFRDPFQIVRVELPEGRLRGMVTGAASRPVADALVAAYRPDHPDLQVLVHSDARGWFEFDYLSSGTWMLEARDGDLRSRPVARKLESEEEVPEILLRLTNGRKISGRVSTTSGLPVASARGVVKAAHEALFGVAERDTFVTDESGRFEVTVHESSRHRANIAILAGGLPVAAFAGPLTDELELQIPEEGGSLEVLAPAGGGAWSALEVWRLHLVNEEGAEVRLVEAADPDHGGSLVTESDSHLLRVPRLAPGEWSIVYVDNAEGMRDLWRGDPVGTVLKRFVSRPGAKVRLELPPL